MKTKSLFLPIFVVCAAISCQDSETVSRPSAKPKSAISPVNKNGNAVARPATTLPVPTDPAISEDDDIRPPTSGQIGVPPSQERESFGTFITINSQIILPKCVPCHGKSGGLNLESYEFVVRAIDAIRVHAVLDDGDMPPAGLLPKDQRELLGNWIDAGAPRN